MRRAALVFACAALFTAGAAVAGQPPAFCARHPDNPNCRTASTSTATSTPTSTSTSTASTTTTTTTSTGTSTTSSSTSTSSSTTVPPPATATGFGISTGSGPDTVTAWDSATRGRYYDLMRAAGATSVRVDYYGQPINDQVVSDAVTHGLHVLVDPTRIGSYPGDCTAAASRYGPLGVRWFELGNEPNVNGVAPATYAAKAKACAAAIRAVLPDALVVIGALSNFGVYPQTVAGAWNPVLYLEQVLSALNGDVGWISAVSFHPYGFTDDATAEQVMANPSGWPQIAQASPSIVSTEARYGVAQRVWVTEHGAPTDSPTWTGGISEAEQARLVTLSIAAFKAAPWAGVFDWYSGRDRPFYDSTREGHFGLLRGDWSQKPAYAAFATAAAS